MMDARARRRTDATTGVSLTDLALHLLGATAFESDLSGRMQWLDDAARVLGLEGDDLGILADDGLMQALSHDVCLHRAQVIEQSAERVGAYRLEYQIQRNSGLPQWVEERGQWSTTPAGVLVLHGVIRVIADRKRREARLEFLTSRDDLTGVFNRTRLREYLEDTLATVVRQDSPAAYLVARIDDLGFINTDYGFDVADQVISSIARRIETTLKPGDLVGRVAGNKFGVILMNCAAADIEHAAQALIAAVREPVIDTAAGPISVSVSVGGTPLPAHAPTSEAAMAAAENALERAKAQGRGAFALAPDSAAQDNKRRRNATLAEELVAALDDGRVRLAFQPIVDATTRKVRHYEALIRLLSEDGVIKPAGEFIEAAEALGLVHLLDRSALELGLDLMAKRPDVRLAVNVSAATVQDPVMADAYLSTLEASGPIARRVIVELTETCLASDRNRTSGFVARVHEAGARFSIDDFGAGYTSFQNLLAFDVDQVKIDGTFITDFSNAPHNQTFVRTLVDLAKSFRLETVAEWVGSEADAEALRAMGVDALQGFALGVPERDIP
jgi:diguanylate cyclase (GGDEF)-like protein